MSSAGSVEAHLEALHEAEIKVVKLMQIAANLAEALSCDESLSSCDSIKADMATFVKLLKVRTMKRSWYYYDAILTF